MLHSILYDIIGIIRFLYPVGPVDTLEGYYMIPYDII